MKKRYLIGLSIILIIIIGGITFINRAQKKPLTYMNAIEKVYNSNIRGMAVGVSRADNFYRKNEELLLTEAGSKENNFSTDSQSQVKLWEAKQLFLNIKDLKLLREGVPEILAPQNTEYYLILTNQDYDGKDTKLNIYYLELYVNSKNYHIYLPKDYIEPDKLLNTPAVYMEYEPNEITKKLINDIIAINKVNE